MGKKQTRAKGTVRMISKEKRYGFLVAEGLNDHFFHASETGDLFDMLNVGDVVEFTSTEGPKGLRAADVRLA